MYIETIKADYCAARWANKHASTDSARSLWYSNWTALTSGSSWRGRVPSGINEASVHVTLQATNYSSNRSDRQRWWRTLLLHGSGGGGKSRPERRLTVTPFQPAIAIRVPAQTACCDLVLFVPGMRPCQSDVCCLAGQRLDVLELREVLLAANVPRISTVSSSCCASEAAKTTES